MSNPNRPSIQAARASVLNTGHRGTTNCCLECKRKYKRGYYRDNREQILSQRNAWIKANPIKIARARKQWYLKNRSRAADMLSAWRMRNKDRIAYYNAKYYALRKGGFTDKILTKSEWDTILESYKYSCGYCGDQYARITIDHAIPLSRGGLHSAENIVPCCLSCNSTKSDKTVD